MEKSTTLLQTESIKNEVPRIFETAIGVFNMDPIAAIEAVKDLYQMPLRVRDNIFLESLETYLENLNEITLDDSDHMVNNLQKFSEVLAELTPNEEAHYIGDPDRVREYSKRVIKVLDDCASTQKAIYIANLSRALANRLIDKNSFFKLCKCVRTLTDEDLLLLKSSIPNGVIDYEVMVIDDFRSVGLMYEINGGFAYSKRAYDLVEYALDYERGVHTPDSFPSRLVTSVATKEDVERFLGIDLSKRETIS